MENKVQDNWYEHFFTGINCEMWERAIPDNLTAKEVDFLIDVMNVKPGSELLDIPCGFGRLSIPLAKRGFKLTGVDISEQFITGFKNKIKGNDIPIRILQGNILSLEIPGSYDGAFCMGNSFGYFDYQGMEIFVKKLAACLKPGARFVINSGMVAESIIPKIPQEKTYILGDLSMQINNEYIVSDSYMISHLTYTKNGLTEQHSYKHYVHTIGEIKRLLGVFKLKIIALYNGFEKGTYQLGDPQVYIVCEKRK